MADASRITFDADAHRYYVRGMEYPSTTTVIKDLKLSYYPRNPSSVSLMARGTQVHSLVERYERGTSLSTQHPELDGYLQAWMEWRKAFGGNIEWLEEKIASDVYRYAGTTDAILIMATGQRWIVEIKTGAEAAWHRLQTASYAIAGAESGMLGIGGNPEDFGRVAVYLDADGKFRERIHANQADLNGWRNAVSLYHWKRTR